MEDNTDGVAAAYHENRIGYSSDLYATLNDFGLPQQGTIVDVACGTGLASEPLYDAGAKLTGIDHDEVMLAYARERFPKAKWVRGDAEALPFADKAFDGAICAQSFHWFGRVRAMNEMVRVVKSGGVVAIWWKHFINDDPVKLIRDEAIGGLGMEPPSDGLTGGFVEFYGTPMADHTLRVIPWRVSIPLERYMAHERSGRTLRRTLGPLSDQYFETLEDLLHDRFGPGNPGVSLGYLQFLYLGKTL